MRSIRKPTPNNQRGMKQALHDVREDLSAAKPDALVASMPEKIKVALKARGMYIRRKNYFNMQHFSPAAPICSKTFLHRYTHIMNKCLVIMAVLYLLQCFCV